MKKVTYEIIIPGTKKTKVHSFNTAYFEDGQMIACESIVRQNGIETFRRDDLHRLSKEQKSMTAAQCARIFNGKINN